MTRTVLSAGQVFNGWKFIQDEGLRRRTQALAIFECLKCRGTYTRPITDIVTGRSKKCAKCANRSKRRLLISGARFNNWVFVRDDGHSDLSNALMVFRCLLCERELN